MPDHSSSSNHFKKLKWRCRRGILEVEIFLQRVLAQHYETFLETEKKDFACLLEVEDQSLLNWFIHKQQPEPTEPLSGFIQKLQRCNNAQ